MELSIGRMELALLRADLDAFTLRFYQKAGSMYVRFDEARSEAARLRSRFAPAAHREFLAAQDQWKLSRIDCQQALERPAADPERLRRLHRELARLCHPDLAQDPVRRELCERLMTAINTAVQDADHQRLDAIRLTIQGGADASVEMAGITSDIAFQLNARNQYAIRQQQDLMEDLTDWLYGQAGQAQARGEDTRPIRLYSNLMQRAMEDLQSVSIRLLRFPKNTSLGDLHTRAERNIDTPTTVLGDASGAVRVPFGKAILLRLSKNCHSLESLRVLDPEDINGLIDEWPDFVALTDEMLEPLAIFNRIEELHLSGTPITGHVFDSFPPLRELRVLIVDETAFDDHGLLGLSESAWMQRLDLSSTRVTGRGLAALHRMKSLRDLSLYGTVVGDSDLEILHGLPALRNLNLGLTQVTDVGLEHISRLTQLEVLHLGGTSVSDAGMDLIAGMPMLRDLVLWETKITNTGLNKLTNCKSLRYLDADQTGATEDDLAAFRPAHPEVRMPSDIWAR